MYGEPAQDRAYLDAAESLSTSLRERRLLLGLSQEDVAALAGISTVTYGCVERGQAPSGEVVNPRLRTLFAIMSVLEIPPSLHVPMIDGRA